MRNTQLADNDTVLERPTVRQDEDQALISIAEAAATVERLRWRESMFKILVIFGVEEKSAHALIRAVESNGVPCTTFDDVHKIFEKQQAREVQIVAQAINPLLAAHPVESIAVAAILAIDEARGRL